MSTADRDVLQELVMQCLELYESQGSTAADAFLREHPQHASAVRKRLDHLLRMGLVERDPQGAEFPERLGEFRLLRRLGSGGMGVVYLAQQESLGREVALKLIRPEHLYFPGAKERFRREVEAVARLRHPGIVPVHSVGEEGGIPFFAMEFIEGVTLEDVLKTVRGQPTTQLQSRDLAAAVTAGSARHGTLSLGASWVEACLRMIKLAAEAVDHAHQRSVVHRDIKPSNIMLSPEGRVMLLDFGLASTQGASRLTRSGAMLGSIPYMAPEQVRGDSNDVDRRTDVYALGVTLYELLTLQSPYLSDDSEQTRRAILEGRPTPIRRLNGAVTKEAEIVCLAAMERDPARRYPSADALARDLENVLELRPIEARPMGGLLRAQRWVQRHPAWSVAALLGSLLLALSFWREVRARHGIEEKNAQLSQALVRAEANFERAFKAVDFMLGRVGNVRLDHVPQMTNTRRELLEEALRLYDELRREKPDDERMVTERERVNRARADVLAFLGRSADAEAAYHDHVATARGMWEREHTDAWRAVLARALGQQARLLEIAGRNDEARQCYEEACTLLLASVDAYPENTDYALDLSTIENSLASVYYAGGDAARAKAQHERAAARTERLAAAHPDSLDIQDLLALVLQERAVFLCRDGLYREGLAVYQRARDVGERLIADAPDNDAYLVRLADICRDFAGQLLVAGENDRARATASRTLELYRTLATSYPNAPEYQAGLASAMIVVGSIAAARHEFTTAVPLLSQAVDLMEPLVQQHPDMPNYTASLGHAINNLGGVYLEQRKWDEALLSFTRARDCLERALVPNQNEPTNRYQLSSALINIGVTYLGKGEYEEAEAAVDDAPEMCGDDVSAFRLLATIFARCASAAEKDPELGNDERPERIDHYAGRAIDMLERAIDLGYRDRDNLRAADEFEILRQRPEFNRLLTSP